MAGSLRPGPVGLHPEFANLRDGTTMLGPVTGSRTGRPGRCGARLRRARRTRRHRRHPLFINPDVFDFAPDPKASNWQVTSCVPIVFGYGSPFLQMMRLVVGVFVGAPMVLRDGKQLSVREAQLDSANAAKAAALAIKTALDNGLMEKSEVQPRFVGFMGGAILTTGLGYRVRGCHPKP